MTSIQKKLAAKITKRSPKKIKLDPERLEEIQEAITRADVKALIHDGAIIVEQDKGVSRARARKAHRQRTKGRKKGQGTRKGKANARLSGKSKWINRIRSQRAYLKELQSEKKIADETYKDLYKKAKGGFFRSKRHIGLYLKEHNLLK